MMPDLSCIEALKAVDEGALAGLFSFIQPQDSPKAFADLIMHNKKALKKYVAKLATDLKTAAGIMPWDRDALQFALRIYDSPLRETLVQPGDKTLAQMRALSAAPVRKG